HAPPAAPMDQLWAADRQSHAGRGGLAAVGTAAGVRLRPDRAGGDCGVGVGGSRSRPISRQDRAIWIKWWNSITSDEQHLDGNAAGGVLGQIFAFEMTTAEVICAHCDLVGPLGAALVYATTMGTISRCRDCGEALIRIAHGPRRFWVDF